MPEISTPVSSRVCYRKMGTGPALVLLHGFPESSALWRQVWDGLSASYTLLIPDFPGSGNSVLERDTNMSLMADCVKAIMDNEGISRAVIAGHSMGGYVAFAFARAYPEKVVGLSLVHSNPAADDDEKVKARLRSIELIRKGSKNAFVNQMIPDLFSAGFKQSNPLIVKAQIEEALLIADESLVNFINAMIARKDSSEVLETGQCPVQWILGIEDNIISYKKILRKCHKSGVNFVSFYDDCGHMSMLEAPGRLTKSLEAFMNYCYQ